MASERTSSLDPSGPNWLGEEKERERGEQTEKEREKRRYFRVRISHFSLDFSTIVSSNSGKTRGKVDPHCKSYAWVSEVWSFDKLGEVGVFSYLFLFLS